MTPALNLVVLRSSDIDGAMVFYSKLGLEFTKHQHVLNWQAQYLNSTRRVEMVRHRLELG
jgi:hypothetical protein